MLLEGGQRWLPPAMTLPTGGSHQTAAQRGGELKVLVHHSHLSFECHHSCAYQVIPPAGHLWLHAASTMQPANLSQPLCMGTCQPGEHCQTLPSCGPQDKDTPLSDLQRDKFEDLLRGLTAERGAVRDAMTFALDHADCAAEVVDILAEALTLDETPIPTKAGNTALCLCPLQSPAADTAKVVPLCHSRA